MILLFSRLLPCVASFASSGEDIFSAISTDMDEAIPMAGKTALLLVGIITAVYAAFGLRKYLAGDGRGDKEFVKIVTGAAISMILIAAGLLLGGAGGGN